MSLLSALHFTGEITKISFETKEPEEEQESNDTYEKKASEYEQTEGGDNRINIRQSLYPDNLIALNYHCRSSWETPIITDLLKKRAEFVFSENRAKMAKNILGNKHSGVDPRVMEVAFENFSAYFFGGLEIYGINGNLSRMCMLQPTLSKSQKRVNTRDPRKTRSNARR